MQNFSKKRKQFILIFIFCCFTIYLVKKKIIKEGWKFSILLFPSRVCAFGLCHLSVGNFQEPSCIASFTLVNSKYRVWGFTFIHFSCSHIRNLQGILFYSLWHAKIWLFLYLSLSLINILLFSLFKLVFTYFIQQLRVKVISNNFQSKSLE